MREEQFGPDGRPCVLYGDPEADALLIQPVDEHDLRELDAEVDEIRKRTARPFTLAAFTIRNWNEELAPWKAPAVFGPEGFGDGAERTLNYVLESLIPALRKKQEYRELYLGGYSLAGFFSLWAAYQTALFSGIAAVSPSVWFPGWDAYAASRQILTKQVYLSLGRKEEKARNRTMAKVGDCIRYQAKLLEGMDGRSVLEWNEGNHFVDSGLRTAKGFAWLLQRED